jgi:hypothetical protein
VRQEELAYEITQEAFLATYLSLDQLRDLERFGARGATLMIAKKCAMKFD